MRLWSLGLLLWSWMSPLHAGPAIQQVSAVLDQLHATASKADFQAYFKLFHADSVFIGTDASERWDLPTFKAYAKPHFDAGRGWTYKPGVRHIQIAPDGRTAWFDEMLEHANYGTCRGTGVLLRGDKAEDWKVVQYHLTIPVPNDLAKDLVTMIKKQARK
jgi:hypothetical protein